VKDAVRSVPAVVLGTLLNILDGVSYGMIIFPASGVFADLAALGVTMFFITVLISQLIYSAGASGFDGVNGSMMIEVVPFFHLLATDIEALVGPDNPRAVIATTLVAFALSSVLTGLTFLALGMFRLGSLIGFFPRHILVGCIGGVGVFLFITGLTVSLHMGDDVPLDLAFLRALFGSSTALALWAPALALAVGLRVITHRWHGQLILPACPYRSLCPSSTPITQNPPPTDFIAIPIIFYIVAAAAHLDLSTLRRAGWLFDVAQSSAPWWHFYTYFDFSQTHWSAIGATLPTQFALLFFNILHPPLNVPALAVSLDHDVDTNNELVAHGWSNLVAGVAGTPPNYIVYVNTLLFYRVGGTTRIAGFMLAGTTLLLLFVGTAPISYIPVMVVAALIFVLGIDLMKEALWDTRGRVSRSEYVTIASIMVAMTLWDFVSGVFFGIVVSCFFFVVQSSQRRAIRAISSGPAITSAVRRPSAHREHLRATSDQTTVLRLQGFLFFGTIARVEDAIRALVHAPPSSSAGRMRFLVVDLALVAGVDMSAAEAFVRVQRVLHARGIVLVFCGMGAGDVRRALESVGLFELEDVELCESLNDAMEWTENVYLKSWFSRTKAETQDAAVLPGRDVDHGLTNGVSSSARYSQLRDASHRTIGLDLALAPDTPPAPPDPHDPSPALFTTLSQAFSSHGPLDRALFSPLPHYLTRLSLPAGTTLWRASDRADALYLVEAGVLRATYAFAPPGRAIAESMVPGTLAGELSALAEAERNATVVVERAAVLWRLDVASLRRMEDERPELARALVTLVLKAAKIDYDILLAALAARG
ncbi:sulfate transporter family-domain-containing protein, partial [Vararia minispora EC-137]